VRKVPLHYARINKEICHANKNDRRLPKLDIIAAVGL
jgi:hypothetical protein